jgi:tRNA-Thr(GGU) m(6)t(6)A37 methyltransferase TsaA
MPDGYEVRLVGIVHSGLRSRKDAPKQGYEGAPDAWIEIYPRFLEALDGITQNDSVILLTWFHLAERDILKVHPRGNPQNPLTGVFATRSPDRPNPIGLHRVRVLEIDKQRGLRVHPLEAIDGTPVVDIKPVSKACHDD